jgi:hypothetical protein
MNIGSVTGITTTMVVDHSASLARASVQALPITSVIYRNLPTQNIVAAALSFVWK